MFPDFLTKKSVSRANPDSLTYQLKRGRLSSLLFINTMSWHFADTITVKLRSPEGQTNVVDRISAGLLMNLCDLKQGQPTTGTQNYTEDDQSNGLIQINSGQTFQATAFLLPLGHLTLDNCELEIVVEIAAMDARNTAAGAPVQTGVVTVCSIETSTASDHIYTYNLQNDLESTYHQVRELYLVKKDYTSFFTYPAAGGLTATAQDVVCRLDVEGTMKEVSIDVLSAITAITGELSQAPNSLVRAFVDMGTTGVSVGVKVFGGDASGAAVLVISEIVVPSMVAQSVHSALAYEQKRVEKIETRNPEQAAALVAAGKISTSETLAAAKAALPPVTAN